MSNWIPFSNGTEFMVWRDMNCDQCKKANQDAEVREDTCPMEWDLSVATMTAEIPMESVKRIGYTRLSIQKNGNFVDLINRCLEFEK